MELFFLVISYLIIFVQSVDIKLLNSVVNEVPPEFLSVSIDINILRYKWLNLNFSDPLFLNLAKALSPGYLRLGGTYADNVIFEKPGVTPPPKKVAGSPKFPLETIILTKQDWDDINKFCIETNLTLLFDFNVLLRTASGEWNSSDARAILDYSQQKGYRNLIFELGNEPNWMPYLQNRTMDPNQLGKDFNALKALLKTYPEYSNSLLVGPDVNNMRGSGQRYLKDGVKTTGPLYLEKVLSELKNDTLSAVTIHHYYYDGRTTTEAEFLNTTFLDMLKLDIVGINKMLKDDNYVYDLWLGETSNAHTSGKSGLSDTFITTFNWIDKLGVSSTYGAQVVIRQALYNGVYSYISKDLTEIRPDTYISIVYKRLMGKKALELSNTHGNDKLRFYASCLKNSSNGILLYGSNMNPFQESINLSLNGTIATIESYVFTASNGDIKSKLMNLNGKGPLTFTNKNVPTLSPVVSQFSSPIMIEPSSVNIFQLNLNEEFSACIN